MGAECLWSIEHPSKLGLGQCRVNFIVANLVHQNRWTAFAPSETGHKVMQALFDAQRDWAQTQGTYGVGRF
jgi:hypothetical protein